MIRRYLAVLRFELRKAVASKFTWATLGLPVLVTILTVWWSDVARRFAAAVEEGDEIVASAYLGFSKGAGNGFVLGGIMLLLYSSMLFANEGNWKTFKTIMLRPHTRLEWIAGKFTLLVTLLVAMLVAVALSAFAAGAVFGEYTDITEEGYVFYEAAEMTREVLVALALVFPPMLALAAFGLMFSTMTDHTGIATSSCLGSYIALETAKGAMDDGRLYLFNNFVPSLLDNSYFKVVQGLSEGFSDVEWEEHVLNFNIATPLISALVFLVVASVIFCRRNFLV